MKIKRQNKSIGKRLHNLAVTVSINAGIDAGANACHWTVTATADAATHIIDYL